MVKAFVSPLCGRGVMGSSPDLFIIFLSVKFTSLSYSVRKDLTLQGLLERSWLVSNNFTSYKINFDTRDKLREVIASMNKMDELLWIDENNGGLMDRDDEQGVWKNRTVNCTRNCKFKNEKAIRIKSC